MLKDTHDICIASCPRHLCGFQCAHHLQGCPVRVPDTVIFDGMMPRAWYLYDEKNQEIKKKVHAVSHTTKLGVAHLVLGELAWSLSDSRIVKATTLSQETLPSALKFVGAWGLGPGVRRPQPAGAMGKSFAQQRIHIAHTDQYFVHQQLPES